MRLELSEADKGAIHNTENILTEKNTIKNTFFHLKDNFLNPHAVSTLNRHILGHFIFGKNQKNLYIIMLCLHMFYQRKINKKEEYHESNAWKLPTYFHLYRFCLVTQVKSLSLLYFNARKIYKVCKGKH